MYEILLNANQQILTLILGLSKRDGRLKLDYTVFCLFSGLPPKSPMVCYSITAASMKSTTSSQWKLSTSRYSSPFLQVEKFFIRVVFRKYLFNSRYPWICAVIHLIVLQVKPRLQFPPTSSEGSATASGTRWKFTTTTRFVWTLNFASMVQSSGPHTFPGITLFLKFTLTSHSFF